MPNHTYPYLSVPNVSTHAYTCSHAVHMRVPCHVVPCRPLIRAYRAVFPATKTRYGTNNGMTCDTSNTAYFDTLYRTVSPPTRAVPCCIVTNRILLRTLVGSQKMVCCQLHGKYIIRTNNSVPSKLLLYKINAKMCLFNFGFSLPLLRFNFGKLTKYINYEF